MGQRWTGKPRRGLQKPEEAEWNRLQLDLAQHLEAKGKRIGFRLSEGTDRANVKEAHGHTTFFRLGTSLSGGMCGERPSSSLHATVAAVDDP